MNERDLEHLTIASTALRIRQQILSPVDLTKLFLSRIERVNPRINAYLTVTSDAALADAGNAEDEIAGGHYRGPLHGIPVSIKDNIATKDIRTTAGSKILDDWKPTFDATVVAKLKEAGAIILGKTNLHEWALGGTTINPFYGTTRNPWDLEHRGRLQRRLRRRGGREPMFSIYRHRQRSVRQKPGVHVRHHRPQTDLWQN